MTMKFEFNQDALRRLAEDAVTKMATDRTQELDLLFERYKGRPVDEIRPVLEHLFARVAWNMGDERLSAFAEAIHDDRRVAITPAPIDWSR